MTPSIRLSTWLFVPLGLFACNEVSTSNAVPPTPPASCAPQADVPGCGTGQQGYACSGSEAPDDGDNQLVCTSGTPGAPGAALDGGTGLTLYCCIDFAQASSDCWADPSVAGCQGGYGFSCSTLRGPVGVDGGLAPWSPAMADPFLGCRQVTTDDATATATYCCIDPVTPGSCVADSSLGCEGSSVGYTCGGTDTPDAIDSSIVCGSAATNVTGGTGYCCIPFVQQAEGCQKNPDVEGCSSDSYGFSCAIGATPQATQPSLACTAGLSADGQTSYCCTL
jgi:hypothetical protein